MSNIKERVLELIEFKGLKKEQFFNEIGMSYGSFKGKAKESPLNSNAVVNILSKLPDVNPNWLLTGQDSMLKDDIQESNVRATQVFRRRTDRLIDAQDIPLYDIRSLAGLSPIFNGQKTVPIDTLRIPNLPKVDGAVFVTGDSMYPVLKSGDIIVLKKINDIPDGILWGEIYLLDIDLSGDDMVTVKYVQRSDKGDEWLKLVSQNEHHQPKDIHLKKVRAMAHVKASVRFHTML